MSLGPWNTPPNFIAAMTGGASAGLQARGQDIQANEAADRLSLAYNQLAAEEAARNEQAQQRMQLAYASNAIQNKQIDMMSQWRNQQLEQQATEADALGRYRTGELQQRQSAADALEKYRTGLLQQGQDNLNKPIVHPGTQGEWSQFDPTTGQVTTLREARASNIKPSAFDIQAHGSLLAEEKALQSTLASGSQFMNDDTRMKALNRIGQIRKQLGALEAKYAQPQMPAGPTGAISAPGAGTQQPTRVKVKGPGGVSGTIPQGTTLPEGWSLAEEAAKEEAQAMGDEADEEDQ